MEANFSGGVSFMKQETVSQECFLFDRPVPIQLLVKSAFFLMGLSQFKCKSRVLSL